jgi:subtilisin family serine protease
MPKWLAGRRVGVYCLMLAATLAVPSLPAIARGDQAAHRGSGPWRGSWIVQLRPGVSSAAAQRVFAAVGATVLGSLDDLSAVVIDIPGVGRQATLGRLSGDPHVLSIEPDQIAQATDLPRDPHWGRQWGARRIGAPGAWAISTGRSSTVIAIVDTGVDPRHPDLRGRVLRGWDFQNNDAKANDDNGHGTAVAGVAAAAGDNRVGIAGMCWQCQILPVKVLNANGSGSHSNIAAGVTWAANRGADVINLSLATPTRTKIITDAIAYARRKGAVVVAAAGNEGSRRKFYPAAHLARVEDVLRVERQLDGAHDGNCSRPALGFEVGALGQASAVLAGDRAAEGQRGVVDLCAGGIDPRLGGGVVAIDDVGRVQVAVAGMTEHSYAQAQPGRDLLDGGQHLRDPAARHADVVHPCHAGPFQRRVGGASRLA